MIDLRRVQLTVLVIGMLQVFSGCATMFDGTTQTVSIDSSPQGAKVYTAARSKTSGLVKKQKIGVTPIDVEVARKDGVVILELEGYQTVEVPLVRGTNPLLVLDVLATSMLGTSVDMSTGAIHRYNPGEYLVEMTVSAEHDTQSN